MILTLKTDALIAGIVSIFIVLVLNIAIMIFALSLLSDLISSDLLYSILKVLSLFLMATPAYVAARAANSNPLIHSLIIGIVQSLLIVIMMTQTFSWQGTLQDMVVGKMPLVIAATVIINLISGSIAHWMNQKDNS